MKNYCFTFIIINFIVTLDCLNYSELDKKGIISGNYTIGALFPIREKAAHLNKNESVCGNISEYGMQLVEAAFFAVDLINRNKIISPSISLGIEIVDYCHSMEAVQRQIKSFMHSFFHKYNEDKLNTGNYLLSAQTNKTPLIGIIGPENHHYSRVVSNIFHFFNIVQILYSEPLPLFDLYEDHQYSFSVMPNKFNTFSAIFEFLIANNWTDISIVYSEDLLHAFDLQLFDELAENYKICVGNKIRDSSVEVWIEGDDENSYATHVRGLYPLLDIINIIVCFCSPKSTKSLFNFLDIFFSTKKFVVISGDGWSLKHPDKSDSENIFEQEIVVSMEEDKIKEFDEYFLSLDLKMNERNPWSSEFWQHRFKNTNETLAKNYKQNPKIPQVIKSVFAVADALHDMINDGCENGVGPNFSQSCFEKLVQQSKFDFDGKLLELKHDSLLRKKIRYNFYNFQRYENGSHNYVKFGEYIANNGTEFYKNLICREIKASFDSTCRMPCSENEVMKKNQCCWTCKKCEIYQTKNFESSECENCRSDFQYAPNNIDCIQIPLHRTEWYEIQSLVSIIFSSLNIFLALFTFYVFVKYKNTPVVKSSTKELCCMMLFGIIIANLVPFSILRIPDNIGCNVLSTLPPISFALIYAALLIKTNRVARILAISHQKFPNLNPKFLSLKTQIMFTAVLIITEVLICLHSLRKNPLKLKDEVVKQEDSYPHINRMCLLTENIMLEMFAFIGVLILICTYYAVKTRNFPENFNEAKYIGFAMYATILTDLFFALIYFESDHKILVLNLCISMNTLIMLVFLFMPKLYVILLMPEKNTRSNFKTSTSIRCFIANHNEQNQSNLKTDQKNFEKNSNQT